MEREVTCGCYKVEGVKEVVFPLTEVVTDNEFFDFDAKYNGRQVDEITPARISAELKELIQRKTSRIYDILGAKGLIRCGLYYSGRRGAWPSYWK